MTHVLLPFRAPVLAGLLFCASAVCGFAGDGTPSDPVPAQPRQNQDGLTCFNRALYDLAPEGRKAEAEEQFKLAEDAFKKALEADRNDLAAHRNLARLYELRKEYRQAATEFAEVIRLDPKDIDAYAHMALALVELGDTEEAVRALETARAKTDDKRIIQHLDTYIARAKDVGRTQ